MSFNAKVAVLIAVVGGGVQVLEALTSTYEYAGRALDKIRSASIPNEKLPNDSAKNREAPIQEQPTNEPDKEPANRRNRFFHRIWKEYKMSRQDL